MISLQLKSFLRGPSSLQFTMSSSQPVENEGGIPKWSQFVTSSRKHRGMAYWPWAFTERGGLTGGVLPEGNHNFSGFRPPVPLSFLRQSWA
jgi:hypothetical protein